MARRTLAARAAAAELAWRKRDKSADRVLHKLEEATRRDRVRFDGMVDRRVAVDGDGERVYPNGWAPDSDDYSENSFP